MTNSKQALKHKSINVKPIWLLAVLTAVLFSCSKRHHPSRTTTDEEKNTSLIVKKNDSASVKKTIARRKEKVAIPRVISVNDSAAHRSVDGRYYYDVLGHRYWRNNKDGKYYLFDKSMYSNDAFKKPG